MSAYTEIKTTVANQLKAGNIPTRTANRYATVIAKEATQGYQRTDEEIVWMLNVWDAYIYEVC